MFLHPFFSELFEELGRNTEQVEFIPACKKLLFQLMTGVTFAPEVWTSDNLSSFRINDTIFEETVEAATLVNRRHGVLNKICFLQGHNAIAQTAFLGEQHRMFHMHNHNYLAVRLVRFIFDTYPRDAAEKAVELHPNVARFPENLTSDGQIVFPGPWRFELMQVGLELQNFLASTCYVLDDKLMAITIRKFLDVCHHLSSASKFD